MFSKLWRLPSAESAADEVMRSATRNKDAGSGRAIEVAIQPEEHGSGSD